MESLLKNVKLSIQLKVQANPYADFWTFISTLFPPLWHSVCKSEFHLPEFQISRALVQWDHCAFLGFPHPAPVWKLSPGQKLERSKGSLHLLLFPQGWKPCAFAVQCLKTSFTQFFPLFQLFIVGGLKRYQLLQHGQKQKYMDLLLFILSSKLCTFLWSCLYNKQC